MARTINIIGGDRSKEGADYICDGICDEAEIEIASQVADEGGTLIFDGTFYISSLSIRHTQNWIVTRDTRFIAQL